MPTKRSLEIRKSDVNMWFSVRDDPIHVQNLHRPLDLRHTILSAGSQRLHTVIRAFLHRSNTREHRAVLNIESLNDGIERLKDKVPPDRKSTRLNSSHAN